MPGAAQRVTIRPSPSVRRAALAAVLVGAVVSGLYAAMGLMGHGGRMLVPVAIVTAALVGRPALALRGRLLLAGAEIRTRRSPAGSVTVPVRDVGLVELRRGLLTERPVLCLRDGREVELTAPVRFWFRADPAYQRDLAALRGCVRRRALADTRPQWSLTRVVAGPLLTATALLLVLVDPPWASDAWPLRLHARHLPDACRMLDARARALLPGALVDRTFSRSEIDAYAERHTCQWNASHRTPGGVTLLDLGRLSIVVELDHGVGPTSDAAEAHRAFERETRVGSGESEARVPGIGDEAEVIIERPGGGYAWVTVAAHRANVEEQIDLVVPGRNRDRDAAATAEGLARLGLSEIRFE